MGDSIIESERPDGWIRVNDGWKRRIERHPKLWQSFVSGIPASLKVWSSMPLKYVIVVYKDYINQSK